MGRTTKAPMRVASATLLENGKKVAERVFDTPAASIWIALGQLSAKEDGTARCR